MYHCWPLYCKLFTCRLIIVFPIFICRLMIPHEIEFDRKTGLKLPAAASPLSSLDLASVLCCTWQQPATTQSSAAPWLHQNNTNPITLWWHREGHLRAGRPAGRCCSWPDGNRCLWMAGWWWSSWTSIVPQTTFIPIAKSYCRRWANLQLSPLSSISIVSQLTKDQGPNIAR